uniref:RNA polymerase subunit H/Rpb5 C-terminal domain-containing protein n=1 Tax=viral metagenome TaxID=1070528 RepID=A0A6C0HW81_9ZZZZ
MSDLSNVELNMKEVVNMVIKNLGLMFHRRNYMKSKSFTDKIVENLISDKTHTFELDNIKYNINIINQDVKNISGGSPIDDYLNKNVDIHKFLIVKNFTKKTYSQIIKDYKNAEIFTIYEFLEDIPSKEIIPQHILLNTDEKKELLDSFGLNELGRIYSTDIMARYYGTKMNDVFRIIRPNINSGTSVYYRLVVPGNLDIFN